jgi:hypothetical protein
MTFDAGAIGGWGRHLGEERFARAAAAAGVLAAVEASRQAMRNPGPAPMQLSAADLLRDLLDATVGEDSPLLHWDDPADDVFDWLPAPEVLDEVWHRASIARARWSGQRVILDRLGERRNLPAKTGIRLQLPANADFLDEAASLLVSAYTGIESVSAALPRNSPKPQWNWPIKLRVLSAPGVDRSAVEEFSRSIFLTQFEIPNRVQLLSENRRDRADFALIFAETESACLSLLASTTSEGVDSDCLIVTTPADAFTLGPHINRLLGKLKATGFVYQPGLRETSTAGVSWVVAFIRELSHAVTIDVAAMRAAETEKLRRPAMLLSRALLGHSHLKRRQEMMVSRLAEVAPSEVVSKVPSATLRTLGVDSSESAPALTQALRTRLAFLDFNRESDNFLIIGELSSVIDRLPTTQSPKFRDLVSAAGFSPTERASLPALGTRDPRSEEASRFLQAQLLRVQGGRLKERFKFLDQFGQCFVRVRIGGEDEMWPGFGRPFPTELLSPDQRAWTLQAYLFTNTGEQPQNIALVLPARGDSEPIEFKCMVGAGSQPFKARIVVAHANRVLQSAWLEAPIKGESGKAIGSFARGLEMEVKQNLAELETRSEFDAFVVVNDSLTNGPGLAIASGHSAVLRTPPDLSDTIEFIDGELSKVSNKPDAYAGGLESKAVTKLLRDLAQYGRELFETLVMDEEVDQALVDAQRIQVVAAESWARLPIEFFYDAPSPEKRAPLCPGAAKCLTDSIPAKSGPCTDQCPPEGATAKVVCPRGFWGLRKVIEWHRHSGSKAQSGPFTLQSEPDTHRKPIKAFQSVLFAHSDRVDTHYPQASADVLAALQAASSQTATASDWDSWRASVSSHSPLLMVVLPHNQESENKMLELSIGSGKLPAHRLLLGSIDSTVVKGPNTIPGGIVMLMGCETGAPKTSYLGYVPKLRRYGASIIMSTGAGVLGRQISPICVQLIEGLKAATKNGPAPLGEVMLSVRRRALAAGLPIVLALSASGDADWLIE